MKQIAILGSTGSIGTQSLDVISAHPDDFRVSLLTAGSNAGLLIEQALRFRPDAVAIADQAAYLSVAQALQPHGIAVYAGIQDIAALAGSVPSDMVISSLVGFAGVLPTLNAVRAGKAIALANKETLVAAGQLIMGEARKNNCPIIPVDSEHSAIFQCLAGEALPESVEKLILTASGGPFRGRSAEELAAASPQQALKHPNWDMGAKVTIDSASLMNKGLEMIEAHWLFDLPASKIEVVVHPQSIVHSAVQFIDGSIKAQLGLPDMKLPIQYALSYPNRIYSDFPRFSFFDYPQLTFERPNTANFPCLQLAFDALEAGGLSPCVMNAANEIAVRAFLGGKIGFMGIPSLISKAMNANPFGADISYQSIVQADAWAREFAEKAL